MQDDKEKNIILDDEKGLVLNHDYDGIQELDHPLPRWWIIVFAITIVFAVPYYFYYVHFGGPSNRDELNEKISHIKTKQQEYEAKKGGFKVDAYNAFIATEKARKLGEKTYRRKCLSCHAADGIGLIGPNLTDNYWIHGKGSLADVYKIIDKGVVKKGMPAWGKVLKEEQLFAVVAYVMKMKGKNLKGKEPQGELVK